MRYLKTYRLFESKTSGLAKEQKAFLKRHTSGTWTYNPSTGLVDVDGDFSFRVWDRRQKAQTLKGINFGKVSGDFDCRNNQLTSLEGAPREVGGNFDCNSNNLTTLEGAPQKVGGYFWCSGNQLTSLEGAPREVGGSFNCDAFELPGWEWNPQGWLKVLKEGNIKAQQLILPLLPPEVLNLEIQKDPTGMIMKLKGVWNDESFREIRSKLVWPKGYGEEADLLGDLDDVGF